MSSQDLGRGFVQKQVITFKRPDIKLRMCDHVKQRGMVSLAGHGRSTFLMHVDAFFIQTCFFIIAPEIYYAYDFSVTV